jgi:N utilization substance protein A
MIMAARVKAGWIDEQVEETGETEASAEEAETEAQPT